MITCLGLSPALDITYRVPQVELGSIHRPEEVWSLPGGKSLNVARALAALGVPTTAIAPLGGAIGQGVRDELRGMTVRVVRTLAPTRRCVTVIDAAGSATEFYERVPPLDDDAWTGVADAVGAVAEGWLALSGLLPEGRHEDLAATLAQAAGRGIRVAVDTHGPGLETVLRECPVALVKVNRDEAAELLGSAPAVTLARRLHERTGARAIVTDGARGAFAAAADGCWGAVPPFRGRYAVGSGDCFLAGLLAVLATEGETALPQALRCAVAVSAANTRVPGAALFDPREVEQIAAEVVVAESAD